MALCACLGGAACGIVNEPSMDMNGSPQAGVGSIAGAGAGGAGGTSNAGGGAGAAAGMGAGGGLNAGTGAAGMSAGGAGSGEPCAMDLASRLSHTDVAADVPPSTSDANMGGPSLAILAPRPSGGSVIGYWGAGADAKLHLISLDANDQRGGGELVLDHPTNWFASIVAHDDGVAALAFQRRDWWPRPGGFNDVFFARWNDAGEIVFDKQLGNNYSGFYRAGKLAFTGDRYVAYYPINSEPDSSENGHEGDTLR